MTILLVIALILAILAFFINHEERQEEIFLDYTIRKLGYLTLNMLIENETTLPEIIFPYFMFFPKIYLRIKLGNDIYKELYKTNNYLILGKEMLKKDRKKK